MRPIDLDKLEQLASAATPGPWKWHESYGSMALYKDNAGTKPGCSDAVLFAESVGYENSSVVIDDSDAEYIEAVSPDVVLALIGRLRMAERAGTTTPRTGMPLMSPGPVKTGKTLSVVGRPMLCAFRPEEIRIHGDPSRWRVHGLKVGDRPQGGRVFQQPISAEQFRKGGIMSEFRLEVCQVSMDFIMEVEYVGPLDEGEVFEAECVGTAVL